MMTTAFSRAAAALCLCVFWTTGFALTTEEEANILYLKQEEKLARDLYNVMRAKWESTLFTRTAQAKERHIDEIDKLISRYKLVDPTPKDPGKFSIAAIQNLYDLLLAKGQTSLKDALEVAVIVEDTVIEDLTDALRETQERPLSKAFTTLREGGRDHLKAFNKALSVLR